jgi:hypothetical protein
MSEQGEIQTARCRWCGWKIRLSKAGFWHCGGTKRCHVSPDTFHHATGEATSGER